MRIVILINQAKQQLLPEISQSRLKFWIKSATLESLDQSDVWSKLYAAFNWSNQSVARSLADQKGIMNPCLIATSVNVSLGMRDSECHTLNENDALITDAQIKAFNVFFDGIFRLHTCTESHYLIEFNGTPDFALEKHFWPPYLGDYREQIHAARGDLIRHLTEMQSWCYQQDSAWNALYLWSDDNKLPTLSISIEDRTNQGVFSVFKLLTQDGGKTDEDLLIGLHDLAGIEPTLLELEDRCKSGELEKIYFSFTGTEMYSLSSDSFRSWFSKLFRWKNN